MSVVALTEELDALGVGCRVEARGGLAVLTPRGDAAAFADDGLRAAVVRAALAHGFSHVALELPLDMPR